jgi:hypothetical protein
LAFCERLYHVFTRKAISADVNLPASYPTGSVSARLIVRFVPRLLSGVTVISPVVSPALIVNDSAENS